MRNGDERASVLDSCDFIARVLLLNYCVHSQRKVSASAVAIKCVYGHWSVQLCTTQVFFFFFLLHRLEELDVVSGWVNEEITRRHRGDVQQVEEEGTTGMGVPLSV
uniref:Uncharacterized protein n=1 Tax=Trypanosoma vivax (strain Y486) TaxID=1055687 RepID=G0TYR5_TRYVY|nr:conserved hypothetical protein [Trypanosoma vivax Y486]